MATSKTLTPTNVTIQIPDFTEKPDQRVNSNCIDKEADAIIGYRADDSYFSFARAFVNNEISLRQLSYAMKLGELGEQFVLKSEKAFSSIRFISSEKVSNAVYFPRRKQRDDAARAAFREELDRGDLDGLFIRDIIRERILPDDPRLR